jgi:pre-mRNA-processing factor 17
MAINCDGSIVASGSAKGVMLLWNWDSPKRAPLELDGHQGGHVHMEFHPILTNSLATCGWDGTVKIWK